MKRLILFFAMCLLFCKSNFAKETPSGYAFINPSPFSQTNANIDTLEIGFNNKSATIQRKEKKNITKRYTLDLKKLAKDTIYNIAVEIDSDKTTLHKKSYLIETPTTQIKGQLKDQTLSYFVTIQKDSLYDKDQLLVLKLKITNAKGVNLTKQNKAKQNTFQITVKGSKAINNLNYLAYVGTNFDLVDGIQPKKIFFATNIFLPNNNFNFPYAGVYVSLYGNRSFSFTDSITNEMQITDYKLLPDSMVLRFSEKVDRINNYSSDNIGAEITFPFVFPRKKHYNKNVAFNFYIAPTVGFIWRRSINDITYINNRQESIDSISFQEYELTDLPSSENQLTINGNQFEFNYGIGFFLDHTNEHISVRFNWAIGRSTPYTTSSTSELQSSTQFKEEKTDTYFSGKLWITEPRSGLTIQAEVFNRKKSPTPYYVVTLSKAINIRTLGSILKPLSSF